MQVIKNNKQLSEGRDYSFDPLTGIITLTEPLKPPRKWWQFWKKNEGKITLVYSIPS